MTHRPAEGGREGGRGENAYDGFAEAKRELPRAHAGREGVREGRGEGGREKEVVQGPHKPIKEAQSNII